MLQACQSLPYLTPQLEAELEEAVAAARSMRDQADLVFPARRRPSASTWTSTLAQRFRRLCKRCRRQSWAGHRAARLQRCRDGSGHSIGSGAVPALRSCRAASVALFGIGPLALLRGGGAAVAGERGQKVYESLLFAPLEPVGALRSAGSCASFSCVGHIAATARC